MGNLKQCYLFLNLINQSIYHNQKLELKFHQNYNFDWKILPEFSNKFLPNPNITRPHPIYSQNSMNPFSNSNNSFRNSSLNTPKYSKIERYPFHQQQQKQTPYFPGRISKPNWIQRKFKSLTSHQLLNSPPNYNRYYNRENEFRSFQNETSSIRYYPSPSKQFFQEKQETESNNLMTLSRSNNEKNINEEERKKALKQKLLDVFKNLSETKFI